MVVTPLIREDGSKVLVRRGWIAKSKANPATRPESRTIDIATVYGLVRRGEKGNTFSPANRPGQNEWFVTDIDEMAAHTQSAPIFVDAIYDSHTSPPSKLLLQKGIPLGCSSDMAIRNNHMEYIVTWYALAAATAVMYGVLMFQRKQPSQVQQRLKRMNRL
ncbi:surf-like protein [Dimargaris verticillata]|uniref:SURF1-like protein n=1 Tax=Dimargaris verticillata TaxID=2761393 RepID=A0A9W8B1L1_9FUNG|nr:surf-like protein [Dimargaris verticillata]